MRISIRTKQIFSLTGMILVVSSVMGTCSFIGASSVMRKQLQRTLQTDADRLAESYTLWLDGQLSNLQTLAENLPRDGEDAINQRLSAEAKRLGFNSISMTDKNGVLKTSTGSTLDLSKRLYMQEVLRTKGPAVSDPVFSAAEGQEDLLVVLFAVPVLDDANLMGVLVGQRNAEYLSEKLSTITYGDDSFNYILSKDGTPIAHTNSDEVRKKTNVQDLAKSDPSLQALADIERKMMNGDRGIGLYTHGGDAKIMAYAPIQGRGWSVGVTAHLDEVLAPLKGLATNFILISLGAILMGFLFAIFMGSAFAKPLKLVAGIVHGISQGEADLTQRIQIRRGDEIGGLVDGFNHFIEKLHGIIKNLKEAQGALGAIGDELAASSHEAASAISQILANVEGVRRQSSHQAESTETAVSAIGSVADGVTKLDTLIEEQASANEKAAASIEEMVGNIESVTASVEKMATRFSALIEASADGKQKQEVVDGRVKEIASQSELLMEANEVIAGIASQTNLLAMNAAIEAAHAGEAGKGFSVVADEIRRLSETSAEQSRTIGAELSRIRTTIQEVVEASKDSEAAFASVNSEIDDTGHLVSQIERAMAEQREGSKQVLDALRDMNTVSAGVREKADQMKESAERARYSMQDLAETSSTILSSMDEMGAGAEQINGAAQSVSSLAEATNDNIRTMEEQIGRFVV